MSMDMIDTSQPAAIDAEHMSSLTTEALRQRLADAITVSARGIYETALIFEELRRRGEPVDELRLSLAPYLPRIARGELAAEAVIALAGFRTALNRIALLPVDEQRAILTRRIEVVSSVIDGRRLTAHRAISEMTAREVEQVISDDGRVRDVSEQSSFIESGNNAREARRNPKIGLPRGSQPAISISGDYIRVGRQAVRIKYLVEQLSKLGVLK